MPAPTENENWLIDAGDDLIEKKARKGSRSLSALEKLIYCLWVADYGIRNAGDLESAKDVYPKFKTEGLALARKLELKETRRAFALSKGALESEYIDRFEAICDEIRAAIAKSLPAKRTPAKPPAKRRK